MQSIISNYQNGNLTDAKAQAHSYSFTRLLNGLREHGYSPDAAIAIAAYLKGEGTYQAACDAERAECAK